jgi:thioredoxin
MKPVVVSTQNFDSEVVKSNVPVLVDFWASWCAPCKMIAPIVEELATEYNGKLKVAKLDVDANREVAMSYNIMSIPTLLIFDNGRVADQLVGAVPKSMLIDKIKRVLERN